ncbi:uncharacterized protein J3D65DRAFT_69177 [Phyllosticta citribraziliensis]|uniref:Uncharacterized protein n=1 Tax=Phyllosticta citribraziliensis TaxID=989973 RepID=A0ABR1LEZ2_9PEZI
MLLHLLAISTDDPGTYRGCIRRALHICQTMADRTIAENIWKKTFHITDEMDEDFSRSSKAPVIRESDNGSPKPLDTITEEEDNTIDSPEKPSCPSVPSRWSAPNSNIDENKIPEALHHPSTKEPSSGFEEDPADAAYSEFIAELRADALRRKEATDRHIASLDLELWRRTHATQQYIADLAADVAQRRRATEQYLADLERTAASNGLGVARD